MTGMPCHGRHATETCTVRVTRPGRPGVHPSQEWTRMAGPGREGTRVSGVSRTGQKIERVRAVK